MIISTNTFNNKSNQPYENMYDKSKTELKSNKISNTKKCELIKENKESIDLIQADQTYFKNKTKMAPIIQNFISNPIPKFELYDHNESKPSKNDKTNTQCDSIVK